MQLEESILSRSPEEKFKIVIVGETGVGKTSLFKKFISDRDDDSTMNGTNLQQAIDFRIKSHFINKQPVKYYLWDTAGQEKYRSLVSAYFKGCQGVLILFDLTDKESLSQALELWLPLCLEKTNKAVLMLVGNKMDLDVSRIHGKIEMQQLATQRGILYSETSATQGINVKEVFEQMGMEIKNRVTKGLKQLADNKIDQDDQSDYRGQAAEIMNNRTSHRLSDKIQIVAPKQQQKDNQKCNC